MVRRIDGARQNQKRKRPCPFWRAYCRQDWPRVISDGPYAESKEAVGGFVVVEAANIEEAIALAKTNPTIAYGTTVEIRPVFTSHEECPLTSRLKELEREQAAVAA